MSDSTIDDPFEIAHQPGTAVDWYLQRMAASGISKFVATQCGFKLRMDDLGAYFTIPYFTIDGVQTTYERHRNREEHQVIEQSQSGGTFKGKYTQPKGSKNRLYWPPLGGQRVFFNSPHVPLIVCEGELKAVACQMSSAKDSYPALICGVPGTRLAPEVAEELLNINCQGRNDKDQAVSRKVFLSFDWNVKGAELECLLELEMRLRKLFQGLGAEVLLLRWEVPEGAGPQKLDDWLVAGGHLTDAIQFSEDSHLSIATEYQEVWDYLNEHYALCHGRYIPLQNITQKYNSTDLNTMEGEQRIQISPKKWVCAAEIWNLQPNKDKNIVDGYVFQPPALGRAPERYVWSEGVRLLNTAPDCGWRLNDLDCPFEVTAPPDIAPFRALLESLCQGSADWMLNFIAQTAQQPTIRGPHVIIFKDGGGTGKSRLFDTLDLVFGKYSGPVGTGMTGTFNGGLEHLLFACWSDPSFQRWMDLEPKLKNYSGDSKIAINHKYGAEYTVENYGRLLIATNKDWIVPIQRGERRYTVFGGAAPMHHTKAAEYMKWLHNGGVNEIRRYLVEADLSAFDIQAPGPATDQRTEMEKVSAPPLIRMLEGEPFDSRDVWSGEHIRQYYTEYTGKRVTPEAIGLELKKAGIYGRKVKCGGLTPRLYVLRNAEKWELASNPELIAAAEISTKHSGGA